MRIFSLRRWCAVLAAGPALSLAAVVPGGVVVKQGDAVSGSTVSTLNSPFTDGNGKVSFVAALADSNRVIWKDTGPIFNSSSSEDTLVGGEGTMGSSNAADFIYSPSFNGNDAVYTNHEKLLAAGDPAPGLPGMWSSFNSRPQMAADGTAYWVGGITNVQGGSTQGRVLWRTTDVSNPATTTSLLKTGDLVNGLAVTSSGVGFDYAFSDNGSHSIMDLLLDSGSTTNDAHLAVNGVVVARESEPTGQGDNWANFDVVSINDAGDYIFSGDTDGATATDEFIAYNGAISLREGSVVDGLTLGSSVNAASINDLSQVAFIWSSSATETLFAGDGGDLANSIALLSVGDELDVNGDSIGDWVVTDFNASNIIGPGLDLAQDGRVFVEVDLQPIGGGTSMEAIIHVAIPEPSALALMALGVTALRRRR